MEDAPLLTQRKKGRLRLKERLLVAKEGTGTTRGKDREKRS